MVTAVDPSGLSASVNVTVRVVDVNEKPVVTLDTFVVSGAASIDYPETSTATVGTYTAAGTKATGVTWSLTGSDASDFSISTAGALSFRAQPDFESPDDTGSDNTYNLIVRARNSGGEYAIRTVTVTVTNVDESGTVSLSPTTGNVGTAITATLTDPDNVSGTVVWQWSRSLDGASRFTTIAGATASSYTPVADDVGNYLRATATYGDGHGGSKTANTVTTASVTSVTDSPGSVALSPTQLAVGTAVTASLSDSDGSITGSSWQWASSSAATGPWSDISGAIGSSYTPVAADVGKYLRAEVTYTDAIGSGRTASRVSSSAVAATSDTPGAVALTTGRPFVGTAITATLTDSDGSIANLTWQWESASSLSGPWSDISGATSSSYTPVTADVGRYLRASASYDDVLGTGKSASKELTSSVQANLLSRYDTDTSGKIERSEAIQAVRDYFSQLITRIQTLEVIRLYFSG